MKNIKKIKISNYLPHRYPNLMIDKILKIKNNFYIKTIKNISNNDIFLQGHFYSNPIFPGVMIIETMAQSSYLLFSLSNKINLKKKLSSFFFVGVNFARFKSKVFPGDQLVIKSIIIKKKISFYFFKCIAIVSKKVVCESELMFYFCKNKTKKLF
ncbi:3-hydroxyacyl-ACP dehydratase FabZ [Buchnera aphidicola (Taiwanaphis decaspermi)]|uniref:3-hydroxyacyl-ACP dehydratase FabZ n=1 Tax=Buchnera aphidicola TaxID=9 RepID=UPI0031B877B6